MCWELRLGWLGLRRLWLFGEWVGCRRLLVGLRISCCWFLLGLRVVWWWICRCVLGVFWEDFCWNVSFCVWRWDVLLLYRWLWWIWFWIIVLVCSVWWGCWLLCWLWLVVIRFVGCWCWWCCVCNVFEMIGLKLGWLLWVMCWYIVVCGFWVGFLWCGSICRRLVWGWCCCWCWICLLGSLRVFLL